MPLELTGLVSHNRGGPLAPRPQTDFDVAGIVASAVAQERAGYDKVLIANSALMPGGCPFAPGASGNIVTEDLCFMLAAMGFRTGIDLDALVAVRSILAEALPGEPLFGFLPDAGLPLGWRQA